ncbi:MAG: cytochrome c [Desulfobacterales bacterium]|jgi:cytochrome c556
MKTFFKAVICGVLLAAMVGSAYAAFAKPEDAIRYRKAVMAVIGHHFGALAAVVKGKTPFDREGVETDARVIQTISLLPWEACLEPGSYSGSTTLKASALTEKERFMDIAEQFERTSQQLLAAASSGDQDAVKARFGEAAQSCKACHSTYRNK